MELTEMRDELNDLLKTAEESDTIGAPTEIKRVIEGGDL